MYAVQLSWSYHCTVHVDCKCSQANEYTDALQCYRRGVELTEGEEVFKIDAHQQDMTQLRLLCLLNCAACSLKLKNWADAKDACTKVSCLLTYGT